MREGAAVLTLLAVLAVGCAGPDPGFSVEEVTDWGRAWRLTNARDDVLVISQVVYNGEYEAPLAERYGAYFKESATPLPARLTIGESCLFYQWGLKEESNYSKDVIYIEFVTNRGRYRYDVESEGFR